MSCFKIDMVFLKFLLSRLMFCSYPLQHTFLKQRKSLMKKISQQIQKQQHQIIAPVPQYVDVGLIPRNVTLETQYLGILNQVHLLERFEIGAIQVTDDLVSLENEILSPMI